MDLMIILVVIFAFLGGIAIALLAWSKQTPPEPFDMRKFIPSLIAAIIGAVGIAAVFNYSGITNTYLACIGAFLAGAGVTSGVSNVSGAQAARVIKKLGK